jgi:hypothetical protein
MTYKTGWKSLLLINLACALAILPAQAQSGPNVSYGLHGVTPPLRDIPPNPLLNEGPKLIPLRHPLPAQAFNPQPDVGLQTSEVPAASAIGVTSGANFEGTDLDASICDCAPPDTNMAVGSTQIVQWVNSQYTIYSKSTNPPSVVQANIAGNTLWAAGLPGSQCALNNSGDPVAQYDSINGRWVLMQPVFSAPYAICIAVSTSSDATGSYNVYEFDESSLSGNSKNFPDYPKLGIWRDAYYTTDNIFANGSTFTGAQACAYNGAAMRSGSAAAAVCFQTSSSFGSLLPADVDGGTSFQPASGEPEFFLNFGSNSLNLWKFSVNFSGGSTFTGPTNIPVNAFSEACNGGSCIPQANTSEKLDSLGDRLMYRLAYRNFGTHESLVVNHSIFVSGNRHSQVDGVRWYEIQNPTATPTVAQDGTYSPSDGNSRWMGSIAMDHYGDIALGYSVSSGSIHPEIRYTGRLASDPASTMTLSEQDAFNGSGSQTSNLNRWGDYSAMRIDPADDCTFWYTQEYIPTNGTFNWHTRIVSFKINGSGC